MPFRLLTWNINGTGTRNQGPDQLAAAIASENLDLVLLQEVNVNACTLGAALDNALGVGNYSLRYVLTNPPAVQRTFTDQGVAHVAQPAPEERYAIIRRRLGTGLYAVGRPHFTYLDYVNNPAVMAWIGQRVQRAPIVPYPGRVIIRVRPNVPPPLVDPARYRELGLRRPVRMRVRYNGQRYYIFCWHAPQGGGNGGAGFSGRDARPGHENWIRAGGGRTYPHTRTLLAGDLNARVAGLAALNQTWPQAVHPANGNVHGDGVSHILGKGVTLTNAGNATITALAPFSDHMALAADVA